MQYVIAVYRSRNVAMQVYNFLIKNNVMAALISTPRAARVGCGLSVKLSYGDYQKYIDLLARQETFVGCFLVKSTMMGGTLVTRL